MSILDKLNRVNKVPVYKKSTTKVFDPTTGDTIDTTTSTLIGKFIHYNSSGSKSVTTDKIRERVSSVLLVPSTANIQDSDELLVNDILYNVLYVNNVANLNEVTEIYLEKIT